MTYALDQIAIVDFRLGAKKSMKGDENRYLVLGKADVVSKLYIPSTLNMCVQKMLNHGLNHGFFLLLFKLISCPIH